MPHKAAWILVLSCFFAYVTRISGGEMRGHSGKSHRSYRSTVFYASRRNARTWREVARYGSLGAQSTQCSGDFRQMSRPMPPDHWQDRLPADMSGRMIGRATGQGDQQPARRSRLYFPAGRQQECQQSLVFLVHNSRSARSPGPHRCEPGFVQTKVYCKTPPVFRTVLRASDTSNAASVSSSSV